MPTTTTDDGYLRKVLAKEERIILIVRQHPIFLFRHSFIWVAILIAVVASVLIAMLNAPDKPQIAYVLLFALVPGAVIWWQYLGWSAHKYVVTNRRVLQVSGVLGKEVLDSLLDQLNDVKTDQSLFGRMFDYGDVEILTASDIQTNQFHNISHPLLFKRTLLDAKEAISHPKPVG
jgi:uncharacterized membrane protein YdbT with pleckstrin-like domain